MHSHNEKQCPALITGRNDRLHVSRWFLENTRADEVRVIACVTALLDYSSWEPQRDWRRRNCEFKYIPKLADSISLSKLIPLCKHEILFYGDFSQVLSTPGHVAKIYLGAWYRQRSSTPQLFKSCRTYNRKVNLKRFNIILANILRVKVLTDVHVQLVRFGNISRWILEFSKPFHSSYTHINKSYSRHFLTRQNYPTCII